MKRKRTPLVDPRRSDTWLLAEQILTPRQLEALRLYDGGLSYRTIGLHLGISQQRASALVERAVQKIALELERIGEYVS